MDDLDDDVPDLVPAFDSTDAKAVEGSSKQGAVVVAPKQLDTTVPVTLITGFLGAGKTTLVNYILTENHGYRIAVILNEIGDQRGIEKALLQDEGGGKQNVDEWVELTNGCLCCSVKDDFVNALESLMLQQSVFDYILIETTGLANPGPVAAALWTDEEVEAGVVLDCIVTVVDAKNIRRQLTGYAPEAHTHASSEHRSAAPPRADANTMPAPSALAEQSADAAVSAPAEAPAAAAAGAGSSGAEEGRGEQEGGAGMGAAVNEAQQQVAYADVILLNKTDLIAPAELAAVRHALLRHNAAADIVECVNSRVDLRKILDRGSYRRAALEAAEVALPSASAEAGADTQEGGCGHDDCGSDGGACHHDHGHAYAHENGHEHGHDHGRHGHTGHGAADTPVPICHDPAVSTVTLRIDEPVSLEGFKKWMDTLLWESAAVLDIYRVKGLLSVAGSSRKYGLQAVHELYDVAEGPPWAEDEERCTRVVVIGRRLDQVQLEESLRRACLPAES
eukprot:jgi/Ulvmu1/6058/UM027_0036.1